MQAVVIEGDKSILKTGVPLPPLESGSVLVKTKAVAGNPTDWKHIVYGIGPQGSILGCDIAGQIVKLGPDVDPNEFHIGDNVFGFVHGASIKRPQNGAFAEYAVMDPKAAYKAGRELQHAEGERLKEGKVTTFEAAASIPVSLTTAMVALTFNFGLKLEWEPKVAQNNYPILLWGGATGVAQMFIQMAKKLHGYSKIIVVASKRHEAKLKEYGADDVFDYHDVDVIEQIKSKYKDIQRLVDCVSTSTTIQQTYRCAAENLPATLLHLTSLSASDIDAKYRRDNIKITNTMLYMAEGEDIPFGKITLPACPEYREATIKAIKFVNPKILNGEIHHIPIKIYKNGLKDLPQLTEDIKHGVNSGEKLVATIN